MERDKVEVIEKIESFRRFARVTTWRLRHPLFAGGMSAVIERDLYERPAVAAVLLFDPLRDAVILVEQFRIGAYSIGRHPWCLEIVAGLFEPEESPAEVATREAREEAGATAADLLPVAEVMTSPGGTNELCHIFIGRVDSITVGSHAGLAHEHEDIRVHVVPRATALAMTEDGRIANAKAVIALLWLERNRERVRAAWGA